MFNRNVNPAQFHPNMNQYQSGGMGHLPDDPTRSVVGYVKVKKLREMPGNDTEQGRVDYYRSLLRSGHGFGNPLMVEYNHQAKAGIVGEGNHRLEALRQEGHEYAPVRVVRSSFNPQDTRYGRRAHYLEADSTPFSRSGDDYVPSDMHPSYVFRKRDVYR